MMESAGVKSQVRLSAFLGIPQQSISRAIAENHVPDVWLYKVALKTGYAVDWLRHGWGEKMRPIYASEPRVPLYRAKFPAGPMGSVLDQEVAEEYFSLAGKSKPRFAVPVRGRSMEPDFRDGDLIIVERTSQARDGDFVLAVCDADEEGTFKKLVKKRDGYVLQPLNREDYSEIRLDQKHRIIGKVIWLVRKV